jgi:hypothetical protein
MPSHESVGWVNQKENFEKIIREEFESPTNTLLETRKWFERINAHPLSETHQRFFSAFGQILSKAST